MNSVDSAVLLIKKALENGLGRKNLTAASVTGGYVFFKLKQTSYAVDVASLEVFKTLNEEDGTRLMVDDYSVLVQQYLQDVLNNENNIAKMVDQICAERGIKL
jgi:hypothetical protein